MITRSNFTLEHISLVFYIKKNIDSRRILVHIKFQLYFANGIA